METTLVSRKTKYCTAIESVLNTLGHATNLELLDELKKTYPSLSATTVHRATARLAERGEIGHAPRAHDGAMRYDANPSPHDHFICNNCELIKDANVKDTVSRMMESAIEGCQISGRITIGGICKKCTKGESA